MWNCKTPKAETVKHQGFPSGSDGKESSYNAEDPDLIPGSGRSPGEGNGFPLLCSCLVGYSAWDHKESDTTHPWARVKLLEDYIGEHLSMTMMFRHYNAK